MNDNFVLLPYYTGAKNIRQVIKDPASCGLLWLEILFNDRFNWAGFLNEPAVRTAYEKACIWHSHFKTMINIAKKRKPLKKIKGAWDPKEYRRFLEVLEFVSG